MAVPYLWKVRFRTGVLQPPRLLKGCAEQVQGSLTDNTQGENAHCMSRTMRPNTHSVYWHVLCSPDSNICKREGSSQL